MITTNDMKFYLDPVQDMTLKSERLYITEEAYPRTVSRVGTVVDIKSTTASSGYRRWWIDAEGNYVDGAPISSSAPLYIRHVGLAEDGVFVVGELYNVRDGVAVLQHCRRSDGAVRPGVLATYKTKTWMKAAPWAMDLLPERGDTVNVIAAKLALAKAKYKRRTAMRTILSEAMKRNWNDDLAPLREEHEIPAGTYGAYVEGTALLSIGEDRTVRVDDLTPDDRERVRKLTTETRLSRRVAVPVEFMAPFTIAENSAFTSVSSNAVSSHARRIFDDYDLNMGSYSLSPVLRTLSH
jgi:hypothetical protein